MRVVATLVSNVHGLRDSVIIAENAMPVKPRLLMAYDLGQSWESFLRPRNPIIGRAAEQGNECAPGRG